MENLPKSQYVGPQSRNTSDGFKWISAAFALFKRDISMWVVTVILAVMIMMMMGLIPVLGSVISMLLTHVWIGGLMLGCHSAYEGKPFDVKYLFAGFSHQLLKLVQLSAFMGLASLLILSLTLGSDYATIAMNHTEMTQEELDVFMQDFMLKFLLAMALMLPFFTASWFAPALIVLHDMSVTEAMRASFQGCIKNVMPFLLYGIVTLFMYIVAIIPFLLGLLVVMPLIIASIYTSYRDIYLGDSDESMQMEA